MEEQITNDMNNGIDSTSFENNAPIDNPVIEQAHSNPITDWHFKEWKASLPDNMKNVVKNFNNFNDIVNTLEKSQQLVGRKFTDFAKLDMNTYKDVMNQIFHIPTTQDEYNIEPSGTEGRENVLDEEDLQGLKEISYALQLNQEQAQNLYSVFNELSHRIFEAKDQQDEDAYLTSLQNLQQKWGNNYQPYLNQYENLIENIAPNLINYSVDEIKDEFMKYGLYSSSLFTELFAALGALATENSRIGYNNMSSAGAQALLQQMKDDPETAKIITNPRHPLYQRTKDEMMQLSQLVYD